MHINTNIITATVAFLCISIVSCLFAEDQAEFLKELSDKVAKNDFASATMALKKDKVEDVFNRHRVGKLKYLAVAEDKIVIPGLPEMEFSKITCVELPGLSDVVFNAKYRVAANEFAAKYNKLVNINQ